MANPILVEVSPGVLKWARNTSGLSVEDVAKKLKVEVGSVTRLEAREEKVELKLLEKIARIYKRPLAALLLLTPPQEHPYPHDFRKLPEHAERTLSSKTLLAIRRARHAQKVAKELTEEAKKSRRYLELPQISILDGPENAAKKAKAAFDRLVSIKERSRSVEDAFSILKEKIENLGIIVFQASFPVGEARGLSLKGSPPAMILNSIDTTNGKIFTLIHELCHLLLGNDGICSIDLSHNGSRDVETFCNNFAGYFLVPEEELSKKAIKGGDWRPTDAELKSLSNYFKVSKPVVLRRLINSGYTPSVYYSEMDRIWRSRGLGTRAGHGRKLPGYKAAIKAYGKPFVKLVLEAKSANKITDSDVSDYLNIKTDQFKALESSVA